jgi:hypothetical protein
MIGDAFNFFKNLGGQAAELIGPHIRPFFNQQPASPQPDDKASGAAASVGAASAKPKPAASVAVENDAEEQDVHVDTDNDSDLDDDMDIDSEPQESAQAADVQKTAFKRSENKLLTEQDLLGLLSKIGETEKKAQAAAAEVKQSRDKLGLLTNLLQKLSNLADPQTKAVDLTDLQTDSNDVRLAKQDVLQLLENAKNLGLVVDLKKLIYNEQEISSLERKINDLYKLIDIDLQLGMKKTQECVAHFQEIYQIFKANYDRHKKTIDAIIEAIKNSAR